MILTTNRIGSFDAAFKSRIHLAIKYHPLSQTSRSDLWRTFLSKAITPPGPEWIRDGSIDTIATHELNGRQIKNVVRTAHALAVGEGLDLNLVHINMALKAMEKFETDFTEDKAKHLTELDTTQTEERTSKKRRLG
jgi:SpoVK/Ycf46/Vps4 family AAA+-type ATPase